MLTLDAETITRRIIQELTALNSIATMDLAFRKIVRKAVQTTIDELTASASADMSTMRRNRAMAIAEAKAQQKAADDAACASSTATAVANAKTEQKAADDAACASSTAAAVAQAKVQQQTVDQAACTASTAAAVAAAKVYERALIVTEIQNAPVTGITITLLGNVRQQIKTYVQNGPY